MINWKRNFQTNNSQKDVCTFHFFPSASLKTLLETESRLDLVKIWMTAQTRPSNL